MIGLQFSCRSVVEEAHVEVLVLGQQPADRLHGVQFLAVAIRVPMAGNADADRGGFVFAVVLLGVAVVDVDGDVAHAVLLLLWSFVCRAFRRTVTVTSQPTESAHAISFGSVGACRPASYWHTDVPSPDTK